MAKNELLPFANGEDANVLPTQQWEALTDILENGFQSGVARSEQVNRVLAQGAVASYVLGQLIVDQLNKDATLDKDTLYQNLVSALQENAKDACLPLSGGKMTGQISFPTGVIASNNTDTIKELLVGSDNDSGIFGAFLSVHRSDCPQEPGAFGLFTRNADGSIGPGLFAERNGVLTWDGKAIVTSVNGIGANNDGTLYLGKIVPYPTDRINNPDNGDLSAIFAHTSENGTPQNGVVLSCGGTENWKGQLLISDNDEGLYFRGKTDGTWNPWRKIASRRYYVSIGNVGSFTAPETGLINARFVYGDRMNASLHINGTYIASLGTETDHQHGNNYDNVSFFVNKGDYVECSGTLTAVILSALG